MHPPASPVAKEAVESGVARLLASGVSLATPPDLFGAANDAAWDAGLMLSQSDVWVAVYEWSGFVYDDPPPDDTLIALGGAEVRAPKPVPVPEPPGGPALRFDRRVSGPLLQAIEEGPLSSLLAIRAEAPRIRDVQLRADPWGTRCWASLYCGLSTVLDVHESKGEFWLKTHSSYAVHGFDPTWTSQRRTVAELGAIWTEVETFISGALAAVKPMWTEKEGRVHGVMCSGLADGYQIINREASPSFPKGSGKVDGDKKAFMDTIAKRIWDALPVDELSDTDKKWWQQGKVIGTSPDLLAVDKDGHLLVIEAKWAGDSQRTPWGPPQLAYYAELWASALRTDRAAPKRLQGMLEQRAALGMSETWALKHPIRIVPVLAIGNGTPTREVLRRTLIVQDRLDAHFESDPRVRPTSIWLVDDDSGDPRVRLDRR